MSANIDLSVSKGSISHINTGCLWNTNYSRTSQSEAAGFQPHTLKGPERGSGGRQTGKMKQGEQNRHGKNANEKYCMYVCIEGRENREKEDRAPDYHHNNDIV